MSFVFSSQKNPYTLVFCASAQFFHTIRIFDFRSSVRNSIIIAHFSMFPLFSICKLSHSLFSYAVFFSGCLFFILKMKNNPGRKHKAIITIGSFFICSFRHIFQCICFLFLCNSKTCTFLECII